MKTMPELLAPARDPETGIAAINSGADAVYIGPSFFGARKGAGNSIKDISRLISYSHKFHARVYATVNTVIHEKELEKARGLVTSLYNEGIDAVIFQDLALLKMDIPPVALFASTQTNNLTAERIKFLESFGVTRFILARELDLKQISTIRKETSAELECFIHGALCVSYSGRCYFSRAVAGRSGNRGECAQPCRSYFSLFDENGKIVARNKHVLSLRDLNLSGSLYDLYEAGISSFKIEGRLKDINYVKNTVAWYRQRMDELFNKKGISLKPSSGNIIYGFEPDPGRVFSRGFTDYFINGRKKGNISPDTQKSTGKRIGKVIAYSKNTVRIDSDVLPVAGDGICFFASDGKLKGTRVEKTEGKNIILASGNDIHVGTEIFRNFDHQFAKELESPEYAVRKIPVSLILSQKKNLISLTAIDNEGFSSVIEAEYKIEIARDAGQDTVLKKQLSKTGSTIYNVSSVSVNLDNNYFFRTSFINELRRACLENLTNVRVNNMRRLIRGKSKMYDGDYTPDSDENIVNSISADLFKKNSANNIPEQSEIITDYKGKKILTTRFCLRYENGICPGKNAPPIIMKDSNHTYRIEFDCRKCEMSIKLDQ